MSLKESLIKEINNNSNIVRYKELEILVSKNKKLNKKINDLKELQKEMVHAKEYSKNNLLLKLEKDYDKLYENILNYPIMAEYMDLQHKINSMLQEFIEIIETGINSDLMPE